MINVFQTLAKEGKELTVIGKSVARRQYIYTKDLAAILKKLALMEDAPKVVNAGMIKAYTNYEIACLINQAYKNKTPVNYKDEEPERPCGILRSCGAYRAAVGIHTGIRTGNLRLKELGAHRTSFTTAYGIRKDTLCALRGGHSRKGQHDKGSLC